MTNSIHSHSVNRKHPTHLLLHNIISFITGLIHFKLNLNMAMNLVTTWLFYSINNKSDFRKIDFLNGDLNPRPLNS